jgi:hypothetical protein
MSLEGHQRRFEGAPATSALVPIPDVLLSRSKRPLGARNKSPQPRDMPENPKSTLLSLSVFVWTRARRQVAGLAKNPDAWDERVTRHPDRVRRYVGKESVLRTIRQRCRPGELRRAVSRVGVMNAMHDRRSALVARRCGRMCAQRYDDRRE